LKKALILLFSFCTAIVVAYAEAKPDLVYADTSNTDSSQLYSALYYTQLARSTKRINDNAVLFSYNKVYRQHIFGNDLFNFTDVLQHNPNFVSIYYSPDFPLNRALFRGHLIPTDGGLLDRLYSSKLPQYYYDLLEVQELEILPDGTINPVLYGSNLVSPEVYFAWQGGLFSGKPRSIFCMAGRTFQRKYAEISLGAHAQQTLVAACVYFIQRPEANALLSRRRHIQYVQELV